MKKSLALVLTMTLLMTLLPAGVFAETTIPDSLTITDQGNGLYHIDPKVTHPDDYTKIIGFELTIERLEEGNLGGIMPISALMIARGDYTADDFEFDYSGGMPSYIGTAKELVTFNDSYLGGMFFANASEMSFAGGSVTARFEGNKAIFSDTTTVLTAMSIYGQFKVSDVTWIVGDPEGSYEEEDNSWEYVETIRYNDIATVENGTDYNYVDIEVPAEGEGPFPVILWIHGGAWTSLNRKSAFISDTMNYLVSKGYAIVYAEYTLSKDLGDGVIEGGYPDMIHDLKAAVRFVRANAEMYNLDTSYIAAMGESAGGHLAMLLGTTNGSADHEDLSMGNAEYSSDVQAMVSYFGPSHIKELFALYTLGSDNVENNELIEAASPYLQITADAPPLYLTHGANDMSVSINESLNMEAKAKELLGEENVTTLYYEHGPHASKSVFDTKLARESVEVFITEQFNKLKNSPTPSPTPAPTPSPTSSPTPDPTPSPTSSPTPAPTSTPSPMLPTANAVPIESVVSPAMVEQVTEKYEDIKAKDWYVNYVAWAYQQNLMIGVRESEFAPNTHASNAMIALTLSRVLGVDLGSYQGEGEAWYSAPYAWATEAGIFNGLTNSPNEPIERGQLAVAINKLINAFNINLPRTEERILFTDADLMTKEEHEAFQILNKLGVFIGSGDGKMNPRGKLTRAELATVLFRVSVILEHARLSEEI